eukprot:14360515-Alexandrium_andersonii.AAC.1
MRERPSAYALADMPRENIAVVESEWSELQEKGRTIGIAGYIKVPEDKVSDFEGRSGTSGVFVRCIKRHRNATEAPLPAVEWVSPLLDEPGPEYLRRVDAMRTPECKGIIRRRGGG